VYAGWFRLGGFEFELEVGLPAPPWHTKIFLFHSNRADFQERDRRLLDLLRPHLVHLYATAKTRRLAAALAAGAEASGELVVLDASDRIDFASLSARRCCATTAAVRAAPDSRQRSESGLSAIVGA
jgi:hypothetical protein